MVSMALNWDSWDLRLDNNNLGVVKDDYAIAQSCANAVRLFTEEAYFDLDRGIPHFDRELGSSPLPSKIVVQTRIRDACSAVDGVTACDVYLTYDSDKRTIGGEIGVTTNVGTNIDLEV